MTTMEVIIAVAILILLFIAVLERTPDEGSRRVKEIDARGYNRELRAFLREECPENHEGLERKEKEKE